MQVRKNPKKLSIRNHLQFLHSLHVLSQPSTLATSQNNIAVIQVLLASSVSGLFVFRPSEVGCHEYKNIAASEKVLVVGEVNVTHSGSASRRTS